MTHFFYPVLDALNDGRIIRKSVAVTLRVLGVLLGLGGLVIVIQILKFSFQPDTTTEATLGGMLLSVVLVAAFACVFEICLYRARSVGQLGEGAFPVIQVVSVLSRLAGEVYATLLLAAGVGGCVFLWLSKLNPLPLFGAMGGVLPPASPEASFLGGVFLLIEMCLLALAALVGFYVAGEGLLLAADVASNVRRLAAEGKPPAAGRAEPVQASPAAPQQFCKVCGVALAPGNTFCGNCGTRI
jgi:hypothetical protein